MEAVAAKPSLSGREMDLLVAEQRLWAGGRRRNRHGGKKGSGVLRRAGRIWAGKRRFSPDSGSPRATFPSAGAPKCPQCVGFGLGSPGQKMGRTSGIRRPGGATRVFFWRRRKKWRLGGLLGVRLEMLLARDLQKGTSQARKQNYEAEQMN